MCISLTIAAPLHSHLPSVSLHKDWSKIGTVLVGLCTIVRVITVTNVLYCYRYIFLNSEEDLSKYMERTGSKAYPAWVRGLYRLGPMHCVHTRNQTAPVSIAG